MELAEAKKILATADTKDAREAEAREVFLHAERVAAQQHQAEQAHARFEGHVEEAKAVRSALYDAQSAMKNLSADALFRCGDRGGRRTGTGRDGQPEHVSVATALILPALQDGIMASENRLRNLARDEAKRTGKTVSVLPGIVAKPNEASVNLYEGDD